VESAEVEQAARPRRVAAVVAAAVVLVVAAGVWGAVEHGQASSARAASGSASLAQQALAQQATDPSAAARLAVQAYRLEPSVQARQVLGTLAEDDGPVSRFLRADQWAVDDLVQSPDGRIVYASSDDGALRAWNMQSGALVARTTADSGLSGLALNPAGTVLTGIDSSDEVLAWNARTLAPQRLPLVESDLGFTGVQQAAEEQVAEAGFYDGGRRYFALADSGELVTEAWPDDPSPGSTNIDPLLSKAGAAQISTQDGDEVAAADVSGPQDSGSPADTLYVATTDGRVLTVDLDDLSAQVPIGFTEELTGITGIALDPAGGDVAILAGGSAGLYSLPSGTRVAPLSGVDATTWGVGFDAANSAQPYVVVAGSGGVSLEPKPTEDGVSEYGSPASGADPDGLLAEARGGHAQTVALPDGPQGGPGLVAVGAPNGLITIIDPALTGLALPSPEPSTIAAFSPRGELLLAGLTQQNDSAMAYAIDPGAGVGPSANQSYAVSTVFNPSSSWWSSGEPFFANTAAIGGDYAVVGGQDPGGEPAVFVWNARTGAPVKELRMSKGSTATDSIATAVADDPALGLIVARDSAGAVEAWSTKTWAPVMNLETGATGGQLALAPGGSTAVVGLLFAGSGDTLMHSAALGFIDLRTHTMREVTVPAAADMIAVSPASGEIATEAADSTLRFYHADGTPDGAPSPLGGDGTGLAYNAAGTELAVTTATAGTTVLDCATGQPVGPVLPGPSGSFASAPQWNPDGTIVAVEAGSATAPGTSIAEVPGPTQLWDVNPPDWQARLSALTLADAVSPG
jgi:WD40 repeat protein